MESTAQQNTKSSLPLRLPVTEVLEEIRPREARSKLQITLIICPLFLTIFLAALDFTITSTALPTIATYFHSGSGYTWIGSSYLLANAATTPIWAKLSDIWGRKIVLLVSVFIFFLGSLLCGAAVSMTMLIVGRAVQGAAVGGLVILVTIIISDLFSIRERGVYLGLISVVWALASAVGPLMGGEFAEISWRWCWYINLPISGLAFVILLFVLDVNSPGTPLTDGLKAIDWTGSLAILGMTLMVLLGLDFGGLVAPWGSAKVICLIVFGLLSILIFVFCEAKIARYPIVPLGIFGDGSNVAALAVCYCHGFVYISASYFLPLYFQSVGGLSALRSGILAIPVGVTQCLSGVLAGYLVKKTGEFIYLIRIGASVMTLGFGLFIYLDSDFSVTNVVLFQVVAGLGVGQLFQSPLIALHTRVAAHETAAATATFGFVRNLATSMSIVIGGVVFQNGMESKSATLYSSLGKIAEQFLGNGAEANVMLIRSLSSEQQAVVKMAYSSSLRNMWILYTCVSGAGLLASMFVKTKVLSTIHEETKTGLVSGQLREPETG